MLEDSTITKIREEVLKAIRWGDMVLLRETLQEVSENYPGETALDILTKPGENVAIPMQLAIRNARFAFTEASPVMEVLWAVTGAVRSAEKESILQENLRAIAIDVGVAAQAPLIEQKLTTQVSRGVKNMHVPETISGYTIPNANKFVRVR